MDERIKNALIESARAQQALVVENDALKQENAVLRAKLHDYEKKSKGAATKAAPYDSQSTGQVATLNLSCLEKKRKQRAPKKKPTTVSSSSLASSWGGGGGVAFMDLDESEEEEEVKEVQGQRVEPEDELPEVLPVRPRVGRPPQPKKQKKQKQKDKDCAVKEDALSPPPPAQPRPLEYKEPKERGWKGINHILQAATAAAAAAATAGLVPAPILAKEGLVLTSRTVLQVIFELSVDNVLSAAATLSRHDPALLALCLHQSVMAMVAASDGSLVQAFSPLLAAFLDTASTMQAPPGSPHILAALYSNQLMDKLGLLSALLAAMATRTAAGPMYVDTVLRLLRLRCVASVSCNRASPLCVALLGRACGAAAEAKKREDQAEYDEEGEEGDVNAALKMMPQPALESHGVTSMDLDFSDSDSDDDGKGKGNRNGNGNGNRDGGEENALSLLASAPSDRVDLLSADEATRAGLSLVVAASCLRSGLVGHLNALARDLAFLAANSPSLLCPGLVLGLLCALSSCGGTGGSAACLQHLAYLGAVLCSSPSGDDESEHCRWRRAMVSAIKEECARLGGAGEVPASLSEELNLREQGTLGALCCGEPVGTQSLSVSEALGLMGIHDAAEHADTLRAMLQSCMCASAGSENEEAKEAHCSCGDALSSHPPVRLTAAPAGSTAAPRLTEGLVTASYRRHWQGVIEAASSATGCTAGLERALGAVRAAGRYFDAMSQSDCDHLQGGWRGGPTGQGYSLQRRLTARLAHGRAVLHDYSALALGGAAPNVRSDLLDETRLSLQTDQGVTLQLFNFTSAPLDMLLDAAAFWDYAADVMRGAAEGKGGAAVDEAAASLRRCMLELATIVCCAVLERTQFLAYCSAVGGLGAALDAAESAPPTPSLGALLQGLASFLQTPPSFWGHPGRADVACLVLRATAQARRHEGRERRVCLATETALAAFVSRQSRRVPAFVINLDRRLDRWQSMLQSSDTHGLSAMRVSAVDGSLLSGPDGAALSIPEADVLRRWDSTLNAAFDSFCQANPATPMTNSERGCAASHLKTWRAIAALRGKQPRPASEGPELEGVDLRTMRDCLALSAWPASTRDARFKDDFFLILEDDAAINADKAAKGGGFRVTLERLLRRLPADCDICYLGWAIPWGKADHPKMGDFVKPSYIWQLHAYLLRGRAVDLLLASLPINAPLDNFVARLVFEKRLVAYALSEQLVQQVGSYAQRQGESDIHHSGRAVQLGR